MGPRGSSHFVQRPLADPNTALRWTPMTPNDPENPLVYWDSANGWAVRWSKGSSGDFHHHAPPQDTGPQVWVHTADRPTLVLGSTQPDGLVDVERAEADGIEVCRRRSGGGLVFVDPDTDCWLDLIVPTSSSLWDSDIGRAFQWVGVHWAEVLAAPPLNLLAEVANEPQTTPAGRVWCFADMGHGEVSVDGSKVVGLSQRRTRTWIRIQSMVLSHWPADRIRRYVDPAVMADRHPERFPDLDALDPAGVVAGLQNDTAFPDPAELARRFLEQIPAP